MGTHVVVGGVISPVHDAYAKKELASTTHRCAMLRLALQNSDWIRLSTWETRQNCWTKTRVCLQHHQNLLNSMLSNSNDIKHHPQIEDAEWIPENVKNSSDSTPIQIKLLCGADLLESFGICGLWLEEDVSYIYTLQSLQIGIFFNAIFLYSKIFFLSNEILNVSCVSCFNSVEINSCTF